MIVGATSQRGSSHASSCLVIPVLCVRREGEKREVYGSLFFQPKIKLLFYGILWCSIFSESNASQETMPVSVLLLSHVFSTWQITTKFLLGNQVQNLVAKFKLGSRYCQN